MRAIGIAIPSLAEMVGKLTDLEMEFIRQRGIAPEAQKYAPAPRPGKETGSSCRR